MSSTPKRKTASKKPVNASGRTKRVSTKQTHTEELVCPDCKKPTANGQPCWSCRNAREMAAMAKQGKKRKTERDRSKAEAEPTTVKRLPVPAGFEPPEPTERDIAVAKIAEQEMDRRKSFGKTQMGKLVVNQTKLTDKKIVPFLDALAKTGNMSRSAIAVGVSPRAIWRLQEQNEDFREAVEAALAICRDQFNEYIREWAIEGKLTEKRDNKTGEFYTVLQRSERMAEVIARLLNPELRNTNNQIANKNEVAPNITVQILQPTERKDADEGKT